MQKYVTHEKFSAFLIMDGEIFTCYSLKKNIYYLKTKPALNLLNLLDIN